MSSPQFIAWLDQKFSVYAEKVVPPSPVLRNELEQHTQNAIERLITQRILEKAGFKKQVEIAMQYASKLSEHTDLEKIVRQHLANIPENRWHQPLNEHAEKIASHLFKQL
jgi:glutaredoxin 2